MKATPILILLFICICNLSLSSAETLPIKKNKVPKHLYALVEPSDSGTSVTLAEADKKADAAENKSNKYFPFYFSPLIIVIIAMAVRRRKQREKENKK